MARALSEAETDYKELMQNLDFQKLVPILLHFMRTMSDKEGELTSVSDVLNPLLEKVDAVVSSVSPPGRRMSSLSNVNVEKIMEDQQKYARAIKTIIPTWQGIESTGIQMCPVMAKSNGSSGSLKCRVASFVEKAAMPSWMGSMVSTLV